MKEQLYERTTAEPFIFNKSSTDLESNSSDQIKFAIEETFKLKGLSLSWGKISKISSITPAPLSFFYNFSFSFYL